MKSSGKLSGILITILTDNRCHIFAVSARAMCPCSMCGGLAHWNIAGSPYPLWDSSLWVCRAPEKANKWDQWHCRQTLLGLLEKNCRNMNLTGTFLPHFTCNHKHLQRTKMTPDYSFWVTWIISSLIWPAEVSSTSSTRGLKQGRNLNYFLPVHSASSQFQMQH